MIQQPATVQLTVRGHVPDSSADYATGKVQHVVSRTPDRIQHVHVVLSFAANPAHDTPADVEVEAVVDGASVHVHAAAATLTEAADEASDRLQRQLTDLRERLRSGRRTGAPRSTATSEQTEERDHG
jgi:ribosome-associated translation inhibitor RaiA